MIMFYLPTTGSTASLNYAILNRYRFVHLVCVPGTETAGAPRVLLGHSSVTLS
jgi:hypothetical protein